MKTIAWLAGVATLLMGALYMVVSLNRWEWNRALFFGLIVVIAEIGLATGSGPSAAHPFEHSRAADREVLDALRDTRPPAPDRFAWMKQTVERSTSSSRSSWEAASSSRGSRGWSIAWPRRRRRPWARSGSP